MIRPATIEDISQLRRIAPNRVEEVRPSPATLLAASVLKDEELLAYGAIKILAEAVVVADPKLSDFSRAKAVTELLHLARRVCVKQEIEELHVFAADERFSKFLESYGFSAIPERAFSLRLR